MTINGIHNSAGARIVVNRNLIQQGNVFKALTKPAPKNINGQKIAGLSLVGAATAPFFESGAAIVAGLTGWEIAAIGALVLGSWWVLSKILGPNTPIGSPEKFAKSLIALIQHKPDKNAAYVKKILSHPSLDGLRNKIDNVSHATQKPSKPQKTKVKKAIDNRVAAIGGAGGKPPEDEDKIKKLKNLNEELDKAQEELRSSGSKSSSQKSALSSRIKQLEGRIGQLGEIIEKEAAEAHIKSLSPVEQARLKEAEALAQRKYKEQIDYYKGRSRVGDGVQGGENGGRTR